MPRQVKTGTQEKVLMQVESTITVNKPVTQNIAPPVVAVQNGQNQIYSRFITALALFFVLCLTMATNSFEKLKPADFGFNTWTTWAIKDFLGQPKAPDVVFLGSSLMLVPLDGTDADYTNKVIDGAEHHQSLYFENQYKKYSGQAVHSFNFALPGEMPSDAYLITRFLLEGKNAPKVLVYGVGPRDFMDNLLPSPSATDPFQYLSRFGDWSDHASLILPDWQERFNFELTRLVYLYGQRSQVALDANRMLTAFINNLCPLAATPAGQLSAYELRRTIMPEYHPFEVTPNTCLFRPTTDANRPKFLDNIAEYQKRYKKLKTETFNGQMTFLNDILTIAHQRNIHVMLYAMPITDINRKLLSDDSWELYRSRLRAIATASGASFLDMHESGAFKFADFQDTVHLHSGGGAKLLDLMAKTMAQDNASATKLSQSTPNKKGAAL